MIEDARGPTFTLALALALAAVPSPLQAVPAAATPVPWAQAEPADTAGALRLFDADSSGADTLFHAPPEPFTFDESSEEIPRDVEGAIRYPYPPYVHYNRVDQWALGVQFGFQPRSSWLPRYDVRAARAFNRDHRDLYAFEVAQPVVSRRRLLLGAQVRRFTDTEDGERVGSIENMLAALFFRFDYRDYFEREGASLFAEAAPWPRISARIAYDDHDYRSITALAPGTRSLFRRHSSWRPNPAIDDGRLRSFLGTVVLDVRTEVPVEGHGGLAPARRGGWFRLMAETSGPGLSSDFTFTRWETELRGYWPLSPRVRAKARLVLGATTAGTLPLQKEFAVGGISTLRAHPYKHHRGDQLFLANAEFAVQVWGGRPRARVPTDVRLVGFVDSGQAWQGPRYDLARRQLMTDAGLGLSLSDGRIDVFAARDVRDSGSDLHWTVRLASPF